MIHGMPHGIMFHHFYNEKHIKGQGAISACQLEDIISFYKRNNHKILSANEWLERASAGRLEKNEVCLTFDDSLLCQYEVAAPVLKQENIKAFWFIYSSVVTGGVEMLEVYRKFRTVCYTDISEFYDDFFQKIEESEYSVEAKVRLKHFKHEEYLPAFTLYDPDDKKFRFIRDDVLGVERYNHIMNMLLSSHGVRDLESFSSDLWMRECHLRNLSEDGHIIGLHSHSHPTRLSELSQDIQNREYNLNFEALKKITGVIPVSMSHPCNSYNSKTLDILQKLDIKLGFRANMENSFFSKFEFPREDHSNIIRRMK